MNICLFEDERVPKMLPLVYYRPVYDLLCGAALIKDKIRRQFPESSLFLNTRDYLANKVREANPGISVNEIPDSLDEMVFINGRLLPSSDFAARLKDLGSNTVWAVDKQIAALKLSGRKLEEIRSAWPRLTFNIEGFYSLKMQDCHEQLVNYPWQLVEVNGQEIENDFKVLTGNAPQLNGSMSTATHLVNQENIHIAKGAEIKPGAVLDAQHGPILIDENSTVMANAVIEGPAYVGKDSLVKAGAKIYEGTSIGEVCKVGGEIEETIIHSYSNKQHDGFLGHAYLGSWVNLGADTNNSDLKNNYGEVQVYNDGGWLDTGSMFMGLFMGDHSKSGINTMFNTGTIVGSNSNVFGAGFPQKYIPSFSWGGGDTRLQEYQLNKAVQTAERVFSRRNVSFSNADKNLFQSVFEATAPERRQYH